jgi:AcrR family transcriptional regulator
MQVTVTQAARRAQIVEAATATIAELGYIKASFAQIAKRAGLSSTRLISYHFDDKTELIRAVLESVLAEAGAYMRPRLQAAPDLRTALAVYIEANLAFIHEHPQHIRAVIDIVANAHDLLRPAAGRDEPDLDGAVALLSAMFADGQARGEFRAFDPHVMAVTVRAAIDAAAGRLTGPDPVDLRTYTTELITLFDLATGKELS